MPRSADFGTWVTIACGLGLGLLAAWVSDRYGVNENAARAAAYTLGIFALLAAALRPAWRRPRFWIDYLTVLVLHSVLLVAILRLLNTYAIRLNWALALPFVIAEMLLALGFLWRRNVKNVKRPETETQ